MSACRIESTTSNTDETVATYLFEQKIKIPSYLVAIVVADLVSKYKKDILFMVFF